MFDLLEQVDFLEDLALREVVLHVVLLDGLDGDLLARQLVDAERDLSEGTLADKLDEAIEVQRGGRQLIVLLDVALDVFDELLALLDDRVVDLHRWLAARRRLHVSFVGALSAGHPGTITTSLAARPSVVATMTALVRCRTLC